MKATTLNNCNKRQQSGSQCGHWEGGGMGCQSQELDVANNQIGRCTTEPAQTCRQRAAAWVHGRRSTKSIPGILLPRDRVYHKQVGEQRVGGGLRWRGLGHCSDWSAAVYGLMQPIQMQLRRTRVESFSWELQSQHWQHVLATPPHNGPRNPSPGNKTRRSTHTAFGKFENYFHGSRRTWPATKTTDLAKEQSLRLVSKRHKRVLY